MLYRKVALKKKALQSSKASAWRLASLVRLQSVKRKPHRSEWPTTMPPSPSLLALLWIRHIDSRNQTNGSGKQQGPTDSIDIIPDKQLRCHSRVTRILTGSACRAGICAANQCRPQMITRPLDFFFRKKIKIKRTFVKYEIILKNKIQE